MKVAIVALMFLTAAARPVGVQPHVVLAGHVHGSSGQHAVYVALWNGEEFLRRPNQTLNLGRGVRLPYRFEIIAGRWAVGAFEDRNDNGVLDMGFLGPKEPAGFWRAFHAWRRPRFDDVAVIVDHDVLDANIELR